MGEFRNRSLRHFEKIMKRNRDEIVSEKMKQTSEHLGAKKDE